MLCALLDSTKLLISQKTVKEQPKSHSKAGSAALYWGKTQISNCISLAKGGGEELLWAFRGSTRRRGQVVPYGIISSGMKNEQKGTKGRFWETFSGRRNLFIWEESVMGMFFEPCHLKQGYTATWSVLHRAQGCFRPCQEKRDWM